MKSLLITTIAILTLGSFAKASDQAYQTGGDEMTEIIKCQPLNLHPDMGMSVTVSTGGIAGLTQARVERFFLGHTSVENFIVKVAPAEPRRMGAPVTYIGNGIRLTANFTTLLPNGKHYGTLQLGTKTDSSIEELACDIISQNPQVNYVY